MGLIEVLLLYTYIAITGLYLGKIICHKTDKTLEYLSYGFALHLAIVQVIAVPCLMLKISFNIFLLIYFFVMMGLLVCFLLYHKPSLSLNNYKSIPSRIKRNIRNIPPWLFFAIIIILFQIIYSSYMMHTDADDGHMTTVSTVAIKENRLDISFYDVYDGIYTGKMRESIYSWEFFIAILSKLFKIHPAIIDHSVIIAPLIVLSYIAVFNVIRLLFKDIRKQHCSLFLYTLLILFAAYSRHTRGCFMLLRIGQGKAVLASFLLTMILHSCLRIYKGDYSWRRWIIGLTIITAGIGSSVIGIYMLPIAYIVYGLPLVVILLYKKDIKRFLLVIRRLLITMLPVIIMAGFVLYGSISGKWGGDVIPTGQTEPDWLFTYSVTFTDSYMIYLLTFAILVIVIDYIWNYKKGNEKLSGTENVEIEYKLRILLVVFSFVLFLTFLNPLFCDFVSKKITGIIVYWRLYWILPMEIIIAVAFAMVIESGKKKVLKYSAALLSVGLIIISGKYMYSKNLFFEPHQNYYKIPNEVLYVSDYLLSKDDNPVCIFPESLSYYPRQYDTHITIIGARGLPANQTKIGDSDLTYAWLYYSVYADKNLNDETVRWALDEIGIEHIYMQGELIDSPYYDVKAIEDYGYIYSLK